jgi:hypothetical protein
MWTIYADSFLEDQWKALDKLAVLLAGTDVAGLAGRAAVLWVRSRP